MSREAKLFRRDLGMGAMTLALGTLAAVTPRRARPRAVAAATRLDGIVRRERSIDRADLRESDDKRAAVLHHRRVFRQLRIEEGFCQGFGIYRSGWPAETSVHGFEHFERAHADGRGLILWQMTFLDLTPMFQVLRDAGHPVTHLSSPFHRLQSKKEVARRLVAPILVRGEERSLGRRVMIPQRGTHGYLKDLRSVLEDDHGTVSIRGDFTSGSRLIEVEHLGHVLPIPTGAPSLAHRTGAALITAAVVRRDVLHHQVVFDEPISVDRDLPRRDFGEAAAIEFGARLERRSLANRDSRSIVPFLPSLDPELMVDRVDD